MEENKKKYTRHVAVKVTIKELLEGKYIQNEQEAAHTIIGEQEIYRCNLMATILDKEKIGSTTNFTLDDGTEKIIVRLFEEEKNLKLLKIGDTVLIIGRMRIYLNEKYISPEIIRKMNSSWLKVRAMECKYSSSTNSKLTLNSEKLTEKKQISNDNQLPFQKIIHLIKELDQGEGVYIEKIIEKSTLNGIEQLLEKMIKQGEIFQIMPGKVKIL